MRVVGLTGGIATGKTTVSGLIMMTGIPVVDCDRIARQVVRPGCWGYRRVVKAFGEDILLPDGTIDRVLLGRLIFKDSRSREKLNSATHLPVFVELLRVLFIMWLKCETVVVVDMPLLFETGAHKWFNPTVVVWCDEDSQIKRLIKRDKCSEEEAKSKIDAQMPLINKTEMSTMLIDNSSTTSNTTIDVNAFALHLRRQQLSSYFVTPVALLISLFVAICISAYLHDRLNF